VRHTGCWAPLPAQTTSGGVLRASAADSDLGRGLTGVPLWTPVGVGVPGWGGGSKCHPLCEGLGSESLV
jgi:hypothetical protein